MLKRLFQESLKYTPEGVSLSLRGYRLGRCVEKLPEIFPGLFFKDIELGKLLMGGEDGRSAASYARTTGNLLHPSRPIAQSPHAAFLRD
jgi:hypothetical protein